MKWIFTNELKQQKRNIIIDLLIIVLPFLSIYLCMCFAPGIIVWIAREINSSSALKVLFGIKGDVKAITYQLEVMVVLAVLIPVLLYRWTRHISHSFWREEISGTIQYWISIPVKRNNIFIGKVAANWLIVILETIVLGSIVTGMSMIGASSAFLREMIWDDMRHILTAVLVVQALALAVGIFLGVKGRQYIDIYITKGFIALTAIMILPNIWSCIISLIMKNQDWPAAFTAINKCLIGIRSVNPLFWAAPFHSSSQAISIGVIAACIIITTFMFICSWIVYQHRDMIRE